MINKAPFSLRSYEGYLSEHLGSPISSSEGVRGFLPASPGLLLSVRIHAV
jgi:hypothetical protein